jgi:hypothetical protein
MDSAPDHLAGYLNTTFTDSAANDLDMTVYYPARAEGEETLKDVTGAPYPLLMILHQPDFSPVLKYLRSYGEHLSRRGYVVALLDLSTYDPADAGDYDEMTQATLDAVDEIAGQHSTSGKILYGMVKTSAVVVAGQGQGGYVALNAAHGDDADRIHGVATMDLVTPPSAGQPGWAFVGEMDMPLMFIEASLGSAENSHDAFEAKATGHVSLLNIEGANFTQFMDNTSVVWPEPTADINHTDQLALAKKYLMAFLDFHLKDDASAKTKIYGNEAAIDLNDGTLAEWRYGVLDQEVVPANPDPDQMLPPGPTPICATVSNVGPFPMAGRNVTLEVARILPGVRAFVKVYGPENRTAAAMPEGGDDTLQWTPILTTYGDYVAFISMDDPDHNLTNNRVQLPFTIAPLLPPTIEHEPPDSLELGQTYNLTCRLASSSGIVEAFVNYSDEEGYRRELSLTEDPVSGDHYLLLPAPRALGQVTYKFHVKSGNGAWNITNSYYIPVVDTTPPTIDHTQEWTQLPVLAEVVFNVTVADAGGIDEVRLLYNEPATGFHNVTCGRDGDRWFYPVILGPVGGTLVYSWYAADSWGNTVTTHSYNITIMDDEAPVITATTPNPIELGEDLVLEARVTDASAIGGVWVLYTAPGDDTETNGTPVAVGGQYRLTITNLTEPGNLTYSWWARDVNGHTTTTGDLTVEVSDTVPPEITDIQTGDATVGAMPWVQATVTDVAGLTSVVLEYTDVEGVHGILSMEEVLPDIYEARIPIQSRGGGMTYNIMADDPSGNLEQTGPRTMVIRDLAPPSIVHSPPQSLVEGQEVTFSADVTDNVGVEEVWLYLRLTATASFRRLAMDNVEGDTYAYTLAEGELRQPHVMYYFEAEDLAPSSNLATDPDGAPLVTYLLNVTEREMTIFGVVRASGGDPIEDANVNLVGQDMIVRTDANGSYRFDGLFANTYIIEVRVEGFQTFNTNVVLSAESGDRNLDVTMVPRKDSNGDDDDLPWTMIAALAVFAVIAVLVLFMMRSGSDGR